MKTKKIVIFNILFGFMSFANIFAFEALNQMFITSSKGDGVASVSYNYVSIVIFVICFLLLKKFVKNEDKRLCVISCISGGLLAIAVVTGAYLHFYNDLFISEKENIRLLFLILGISIMTVPGSYLVFSWFSNLPSLKEEKREYILSDILYFFVISATIFAGYIPVFLVNWPGNTNCDYYAQLGDVIDNTWSTHHPILHTWLMGAPYKFGVSIGNVGAGFQIYTLIQMAVLAGAFAYLVLFMRRKNVKRWIRITTILFAVFFPLNQMMSITSTKDVMFAAFFLLVMIFMVMFIENKGKLTVPQYIGLFCNGLLACLFRNNMAYALLAAGLLIAIFLPKEKDNKGVRRYLTKIKMIGIVVVLLLAYKGSNAILMKTFDAKDVDSYREKSSIFFQCMARVAKYRPGEMEQADYDVLCYYTPEKNLEGYNPYNADGLKADAYEQRLRADMKTFIKVWGKVGLQFPDEYIEAIMSNTLGYWYPFNAAKYIVIDVSTYPMLIGKGQEINRENYLKGTFISDLYAKYYWQKEVYNVPVVGFLMRPVVYVWLILGMLLWAVYKKDRKLELIALLPLMYFGTLILGPLVALRYAYSFVVCAPLFLTLMGLSRGEIKEKTEDD